MRLMCVRFRPLRSFSRGPSLMAHLREIRSAGRSAPLVSPGIGLQPTPPPLPRYTERPADLIPRRRGY